MAHHQLITHPLVLRRLTVSAVRDVTPRLRRVTLTGEELRSFTRDGLTFSGFTAPGFDDHVKLIFAAEGPIAEVLPRQLEHGIEWRSSPLLETRDYTPRRIDPITNELDLELVLHGDGPAASWAAAAEPGAELWLVGPKSSLVLPDDIDWAVLFGDETALPAIGRFLDERPLDAPVDLVIAVADEAGPLDLPVRPDDTITWLVGSGAGMEQAVRDLPWRDGQPFFWGAGESRQLLPLRRHLTRERGLARSHVHVTGYWHGDVAPTATGNGAGAADDPGLTELPSLESPVGWFAVRAALRLGLLDELALGTRPLTVVADRLGIGEGPLRTLVSVLREHDMLVTADDRIGLGVRGEELLDDDHLREEFDGHDADLVLTLEHLVGGMRQRRSAWQQARGRTLRQEAVEDRERYAELVERASVLQYLVAGVAAYPVWVDARPIAVSGPGALVVARALVTGSLVVVEQAGPLDVLQAEAGVDRRRWDWANAWPTCDVGVVALGLAHRTDREVTDLLTEIGRSAPRMVLIEATAADALSPGAAAEALLALAATGAGVRSTADLAALASTAGWQLIRTHPLGWGLELLDLTTADDA
jgi:NADPH-dependent ferric siderophore reductase